MDDVGRAAAVARVLLADEVAAAADLDDQARYRVQWEMDFGVDEFVIIQCVLDTRTPLPVDLLRRVRDDVAGYYPWSPGTAQMVLDAVDRQLNLR